MTFDRAGIVALIAGFLLAFLGGRLSVVPNPTRSASTFPKTEEEVPHVANSTVAARDMSVRRLVNSNEEFCELKITLHMQDQRTPRQSGWTKFSLGGDLDAKWQHMEVSQILSAVRATLKEINFRDAVKNAIQTDGLDIHTQTFVHIQDTIWTRYLMCYCRGNWPCEDGCDDPDLRRQPLYLPKTIEVVYYLKDPAENCVYGSRVSNLNTRIQTALGAGSAIGNSLPTSSITATVATSAALIVSFDDESRLSNGRRLATRAACDAIDEDSDTTIASDILQCGDKRLLEEAIREGYLLTLLEIQKQDRTGPQFTCASVHTAYPDGSVYTLDSSPRGPCLGSYTYESQKWRGFRRLSGWRPGLPATKVMNEASDADKARLNKVTITLDVASATSSVASKLRTALGSDGELLKYMSVHLPDNEKLVTNGDPVQVVNGKLEIALWMNTMPDNAMQAFNEGSILATMQRYVSKGVVDLNIEVHEAALTAGILVASASASNLLGDAELDGTTAACLFFQGKSGTALQKIKDVITNKPEFAKLIPYSDYLKVPDMPCGA